MSSVGSPPNESDLPARKKIQRRHGACEPCRSSKTKCDGRMPCGACRSERRRQCPCKYSEKAMKLQQVTAEIRRRAQSEKSGNEATFVQTSEDERNRPHERNHHLAISGSLFDDVNETSASDHAPLQMDDGQLPQTATTLNPLSVCAAIEEFKRLKPARGYSSQIISRCHSFEAAETVTTIEQLREIRQTPPVNANPLAPVPALQSDNESLEKRTLKARLENVDRLIQNGHLEQAWIDFPSVIRAIEYVLTRTPKDSTSADWNAWNKLSNDALDLEAQLALTIGRPTSSIMARHSRPEVINDVSPLEEETLKAARVDLYQRIQSILALDLSSMTATRDFLERSEEILHHNPFIQVRLCTTEENSETTQSLQFNTHLLFMIIYCRLAGLCDQFSRDLTNGSWLDTPAAEIIRKMDIHQPRYKRNYCSHMFRSARFVLDSFLTLHQTSMPLTGKTWIRCHSAYVTAVILGIAKLRHEVEWHTTTETLKRMEQKFLDCCKAYPECKMFRLAADRLQDLNSVEEPASEAVRNKHVGVKLRKKGVAEETRPSPKAAHSTNPTTKSSKSSTSPQIPFKRPIDMVDEPVIDDHVARERYLKDLHHEDASVYLPSSRSSSSFTDLQLDPLSLFQDHSATYGSQSASSFTPNASVPSSATSFAENDMNLQTIPEIPIGHPGPPFPNPFPYDVFHPPMSWNNNTFIMDEHNSLALSLRIPTMAQFQQNTSPVACPSVSTPQYSLHPSDDGLSIESANIGSHQASPLVTTQDRSGQLPSACVFPQSSATVQNLASGGIALVDGPRAQTHASNSLSTLTHSRDSCRPRFDRRNSAKDVHQTPPQGLGRLQTSTSASWRVNHPTIVGQAPGSRIQDASSTILDHGRGASTVDTKQSEFLRRPRTAQTTCYSGTVTHQPQGLLAPATFQQDQVSFLQPAADMFEQNQGHAQYTTCQIPSFERHYQVQDSEQYPMQWRRVSIDAGGSGSTQY